VSHAIPPVGTAGCYRDVLTGVIDFSDAEPGAPQQRLPRPAKLILIEQSGVKREIPQPSAASGIIEAEQAMYRHGSRLREVKLVSRHQAIARWKVGEEGWKRVA
jgi:hypothetical protein